MSAFIRTVRLNIFINRIKLRRHLHNQSIIDSNKKLLQFPNSLFQFNAQFVQSPTLMLYSFFASKIVTWNILCGVFLYFPVGTVSELAVGYLITKFTGKIRHPATIVLAATLSKYVPVLSAVKFFPPLTDFDQLSVNNKPGNEKSIIDTKILPFFKGTAEAYGFPVYVAAKINHGLSILGFAAAVKYGIDVPGLLASWGVTEVAQDGAGAVALATLVNIILTPVQLYGVFYLSPVLRHFIFFFKGKR